MHRFSVLHLSVPVMPFSKTLTNLLAAFNHPVDKDLPAFPPEAYEHEQDEYEDDDYDPAPEEFGIYPAQLYSASQRSGHRLSTILEQPEQPTRSGTISSTYSRLPVAHPQGPGTSPNASSYGQVIGTDIVTIVNLCPSSEFIGRDESDASTSTYGEPIGAFNQTIVRSYHLTSLQNQPY